MHKGENRMSNYDFRATANYNRTSESTRSTSSVVLRRQYPAQPHRLHGLGLQYAAGETPFYPYQYFKKQVEDGNSYYNLNNTNYRTVAFYSNATYSYKGRYVVNGTYRYEARISSGAAAMLAGCLRGTSLAHGTCTRKTSSRTLKPPEPPHAPVLLL